jgi:hypothetical protein
MAPKNKVAPKPAPKTPPKPAAKAAPAAPARQAPARPAAPAARAAPARPSAPQKPAAPPQRAPANVAKPAPAAPPRQPLALPARNVNPPPRQSPQAGAAIVKTIAPTTAALAVSNAAPAWLQQQMANHAPKGLEVVEREDLIMPRLTLVQKTSPAFDQQLAAIGDIIDNVTNEVICPKGTMLEFIPIVVSKSRIYFHDYNDGGGIDCRAPDGITALPGGIGKDAGEQPTTECARCVFSKWDESGGGSGKPQCSNIINILGMLPSRNNALYALSFKSTGIKVSKRLLSTIKQTGVDAFALVFGLYAVDDQSANNTFQNWDFEMLRYVDQAEYARGAQTFAGLEGKTWEANMEDLAQTGGDEGATPADAAEQTGTFDDVPAGEVVDAEPSDADEPPPPTDADAPPGDGF